MRDPKRIRKFCNRLAACWERVPDWRFGQLISNVFGQYVADTGRDIFYPEDKEIIEFFEEYFAPGPAIRRSAESDIPGSRNTPYG